MKLLICSSTQFGYLTDTFKYCQYLKSEIEITYIGWDQGKEKINICGVNIIYISCKGNVIQRNLRLLRAIHIELKNKYDVIFINYVRGISFVKIFNWKLKFVLDVRTLCVDKNNLRRIFLNLLLKFESTLFKYKSIISDGLAKKIGFNNYFLLPLGADSMSSPICEKDQLHLLYIGTLQNRDIIKCVKGFFLYCKSSKDNKAKFTIVGNSSGNELIEIKSFIKKNDLQSQVSCEGYVHHSKIGKYFSEANLGVSFVPIKSYFEFQPPTKTFEYLLSGLPVIATNTSEHKKFLSFKKYAILINDSEFDFRDALLEMKEKIHYINSIDILKDSQKYSWEVIIRNSMLSMLNHIVKA